MKWSPPEVILFHKYSHKSDVWSFGVVIWEVYNYGAHPYPGFTNSETVKQVTNGYRMPTPSQCPEEWNQWMKKCWAEKPSNRPSFSEIYKFKGAPPQVAKVNQEKMEVTEPLVVIYASQQ